MISVEPIRSEKKIEDMKTYLKGKDLRDYALFVVGINVALRISDLLEWTWEDVFTQNCRDFKLIKLKEGKTNKERVIKLNRTAQKALSNLFNSLDDQDIGNYIFKSREGQYKPITRQQALNILKEAARSVGIKENIGTHYLRKTWGYHAWKNGFNPALIMEPLNHSNLSVTKRYLGIRQDEINDLYENLNI